MAWSLQAWRYSLAAIPDPALTLDDRQVHQAIAGAPFPQLGFEAAIDATLDGFSVDLSGTFTAPVAATWSYADRLAVHYIAEPSAGFTNQTRLTIGGVPGSAPTVATDDRDGQVSFTLSGFATELQGTTTPPQYEGDLVSTISTFVVSFVGENLYTHFFDISYSVTPTWVVYEQPARFGDVDVTIGAFSTSLDGYALPPDSTQGVVNAALSTFVADLDGSFTPAPAKDGDVSLNIEVFGTSFRGSFAAAGGVIGALQPTLSGFTADLTGTFEQWNTDGDITSSMESFSTSLRGAFIPAGAISGDIGIALGAFTVDFDGLGPLSISLTAKEATYYAPRRNRVFMASQRNRVFIADGNAE